jgi:hypothetical protein
MHNARQKPSVVRMRHKQGQLIAVVGVCRVPCHNTLGIDGNSLATLLIDHSVSAGLSH